jgi:hypothetical protein
LALPITINSRQQEKLRQMQLDLQGKATAVVNDQLVFIYDCCYTTDDTKLIPDKVTYSEIWDNFDDSFSEEAEEVISSPSTTIDIPQSQGNYNENKPLIVKGLYQYSPISEQYQLVNEKGFSTDNMQSLEAKFRGIIIKNENNTFCFQVTAEQINKLWQSTSKNLISIQLTSEQFKLLEQNQQINNPDKKTFVIVNAAQQVFIVEKVIKKSYFTARNIAVGLGFSFIGVMIYYCIKYNVSFSDLKISELFHKLSFSRTA